MKLIFWWMTFQKLTKTWESIPSTTQIRKSNIYTCASAYCKMYIQWSLNIKLLPRCLRMAREYHVQSVGRDSLQKVENLDENPNQGSLWLWLWWCSSTWWFMENLDENPNQGSLWSQIWHCWWFACSFGWQRAVSNCQHRWPFLMIYGDDIFLSLER